MRWGCIHLDLKPGNLLLFQLSEQSVLLKICDFGLCREMTQGSVTISGQEAYTPIYRPLECWLHLKKGFPCRKQTCGQLDASSMSF